MPGLMLDLRCELALDNLKDSGESLLNDVQRDDAQRNAALPPVERKQLKKLQERFDWLYDCERYAVDPRVRQKLLDARNETMFKMLEIRNTAEAAEKEK